jgi:hypothetical protein
MTSYPNLLALANLVFIGLGSGAVLDNIDTEPRHQLSGCGALLVTGAAQWFFTRRARHPVWNLTDVQLHGETPWRGGTARGRLTTISVILDVVLIPLMLFAA